VNPYSTNRSSRMKEDILNNEVKNWVSINVIREIDWTLTKSKQISSSATGVSKCSAMSGLIILKIHIKSLKGTFCSKTISFH